MARNTSLSLGDHFAGFVDSRVKTGRYASVNDVVHAGLRLLEEQEAKGDALWAALEAGEASGEPKDFDFDDFIERKIEV
ncbi:type II toxin-antitoxin system ParD family antitoxin [uncultured Roseibium sp.]|uniref:type II toxin-antitoxin system ParD family antitoxin n=1 Tax=uncultured Roseibium sp. TaxID=1936171 RepID=UPI00321727D7